MKKTMQMLSTLFILFLVLSGCQKESLETGSVLTDGKLDIDQTEEGITGLNKDFAAAGYVYVMDNDADGNNLLVFNRDADGTIDQYTSYSTGGNGTGGGLGSQGAIIIDHPFVFVVNAGSNEISVFRRQGPNLTLVEKVDSRGEMPISLTSNRRRLYVLNAGGSGNISGFRVGSSGKLTYIEGATQPLSSSSAGGAQVSFNNQGSQLIVTEKATNMISVYPVDFNGFAGAGTAYPSAGQTPFGFDFGRNNKMIVSEAFGGAANASTMSSYDLDFFGNFSLLDGPEATNQTAACWVAVGRKGQFTYTTNTGSDNVTGYRVHNDGSLEILDEDGVTGITGDGPIDMAFNRNWSYLYVTNAGDNSITIFAAENDGSLVNLGEVTGLPDAVVGMAAE